MSLAKTKFALIHIIAGLITLACLLMNGPMRGGLPVGSTVHERMAFIGANPTLWTLSWVVWMFCALGLLVFCLILADAVKPDFRRSVGVFLVALGVAPDLTAEVIYAFIMPEAISLGVAEHTFLLLEAIASHLTGYLGNGLYNLGGLLLTVLAMRQGVLKPWVAVWGLTAWLLGLMLSISIAVGSISAAEIFTASSMVLSTLWMLVFAYQILRPEWTTRC